jgi:hypothetical protein
VPFSDAVAPLGAVPNILKSHEINRKSSVSLDIHEIATVTTLRSFFTMSGRLHFERKTPL